MRVTYQILSNVIMFWNDPCTNDRSSSRRSGVGSVLGDENQRFMGERLSTAQTGLHHPDLWQGRLEKEGLQLERHQPKALRMLKGGPVIKKHKEKEQCTPLLPAYSTEPLDMRFLRNSRWHEKPKLKSARSK